jgi:hypothetical protein
MRIEHEVKPKARTLGLIVQPLEDEVLLYDKERHKAHCLNKTAALVWRLCDGTRTVEEIAVQLSTELQTRVSEEIILLALTQLSRRHLMTDRVVRSGLTRREAMRKLGVGAAIAIPLVTSIVSPHAAQAATCLPSGSPCSTSSECCSGVCNGNTCA